MGIDFYTGLNTVPAASQLTVNFNKTAINADGVRDRLGFYAAEILTVYSSNVRTFPQGQDYILPFESLSYDTAKFWSSQSPTRLVIPPGFSYCEILVQLQYSTGNWQVGLYKNGGPMHTHPGGSSDVQAFMGSSTNSYRYMRLHSQMIACTPGDYFQAALLVAGSGTSNFDVTDTNDYSGSGTLTINHHQAASLQVRAYK